MDAHLALSQLRYSYYTHIDVCYNEIFFKYCGIIKFHGGSIFVVFEGSPRSPKKFTFLTRTYFERVRFFY